ncbi:Creatininase [Parafrankia sp. EUN1f]|nr:Creatininase [Parafrankia sp. EUN1f]
MALAARAWPAVPTAPLVLVPVGSCEQHGPHLPLTTDTTIAVAVAEGAAEHLRQHQHLRQHGAAVPVLVAPPVIYTASGEHQGFPGTMSIGTQALRLLLVELVRSMRDWSGPIVFVNAHGGNLRGLAEAVSQLRHEGHDVAWLASGAGRDSASRGSAGHDDAGHDDAGRDAATDSHAGFTETSLMLHLAPEQVRMRRAQPGNTAPLAELMPAIAAGGVAAVAPSGVLGDPTAASARAGEELLRAIIENVSALIDHGEPDQHGRLRPRLTAERQP